PLRCPQLRAFPLPRSPPLRALPSFPTRRSSDLSYPSWHDLLTALYCTCKPATAGTAVSPYTVKSSSRSVDPTAVMVDTAETSFRSEEHTSELQSRFDLVCRLLLEEKNSRDGRRT